MEFISERYFVTSESYASFFEPVDDSGKTVLRDDVFRQAVQRVDKTKTPGSPLCYLYPNNLLACKETYELKSVVDTRLHRLEELGKLMWERQVWDNPPEDPVDFAVKLVQKGCTDAVLVGFKGEPRDRTKYPRLVSQVSLINQLVARCISGNHYLEEQMHDDLPTVTQLDLTTPAKTEERRTQFLEHGELKTSDIQGWEYAMDVCDRWSIWTKEAVCQGLMTREWKVVPGKEKHFFALLGYHTALIYRVVQLPEGDLVVPKPGEMSSGELGTFSGNSFARASLSNEVSIVVTGQSVDYVIAGGDDCMDTNEAAHDIYLEFGKVVTDFDRNYETYNFCSTTFAETGSYQDNIRKSVYAAHVKQVFDEETRAMFIMCFSNHPLFLHYLAMLEEAAIDWQRQDDEMEALIEASYGKPKSADS